jgi:hypothetical protein
MKIDPGFAFPVHGKFKAENDIVIGGEVKTGTITYEQAVRQGVSISDGRLIIPGIPGVTENIEIQRIRNRIEFPAPEKIDRKYLLRQDRKFKIVLP